VIVLDAVLSLGPAGAWIPEPAFNDDRGWGDGHHAELKRIDACNVCASTAGLIESNCGQTGWVCYRALGKPRPEVPPGELAAGAPEADPEAVDLYCRTLRETFTWLDSQSAESVGQRGEIGNMPLAPYCLIPYRTARIEGNGHAPEVRDQLPGGRRK
jgi:hypothetical protein